VVTTDRGEEHHSPRRHEPTIAAKDITVVVAVRDVAAVCGGGTGSTPIV
jgi:hypothetical protein